MKEKIKKFLKQKNVYEYFKYSRLFRMYEWVCKHYVIRNHQKEVNLYKSFLPSCKLVFDIGAYDGHKTAALLELAERVVSCEPDPFNFRVLGIRFRNRKRSVQLQNVALAALPGKKKYFVHHQGSAFNTLNVEWKAILERDKLARWDEEIYFDDSKSIEVTTTTLDLLIEQFGLPDFIKIDVEGYEKEVLLGLTQAVPSISFECLLPEFREDLICIIERLLKLQPAYVFNVIYNEALLLETFVSEHEIRKWINNTTLSTFDMVVRV